MSLHNKSLAEKVVLVTGATRGIGRGIAIQMGEAGATVYITGRTLSSKDGMGSLEETSNEIKQRGGKCIFVQVDHEDDHQIADLFQRIEDEQNGRLDILVNNAYKGVQTIFESSSKKFWEAKPDMWDEINKVGLRSHYICTVYASRLMVQRKQGLIVNVSSWGGMQYIFNVPYGVGKCGLDRMASDCAVELRDSNVAMVSFYPGAVKTELMQLAVSKNIPETEESLKKTNGVPLNKLIEHGETTEFSGKVLVVLAQDPEIINYSGKVVVGAEYAKMKSIKDLDGREINSFIPVTHFLLK